MVANPAETFSGFYERYLLGEGEYTRTVFLANKA